MAVGVEPSRMGRTLTQNENGFSLDPTVRKPYERCRGLGGRRGSFSNRDTDGEHPRRNYERHSGTRRRSEIKRDGAGRGNWGSTNDDITLVVEEPIAENEVNVAAETPAGEEENVDAEKETTVYKAEEDPEEDSDEELVTLEEYEMILKVKRKALLSLIEQKKGKEREIDVKEFQSMHLVSEKKNDDEVFFKLKPYERRNRFDNARDLGGRRGAFSNEDAYGEHSRRNFERHSGTRRGSEIKCDGAGRGNWGSTNDAIALVVEEPIIENEVNVAAEKPAAEEENVDAEKETTVYKAEEDHEEDSDEELVTLEEYEMILKVKRKALLSLIEQKGKERKVDVKEFQSMHLLSKKKNDDEVFFKLKSYERHNGFDNARGLGGKCGAFCNGDDYGVHSRRNYQRHSGIRRGSEIKLDSAGRGKWGSTIDLVVEEPIVENDANVAAEKLAGEEENVDAEKETTVYKAEEDSDEELVTLEEYEMILKVKRKALLSLIEQKKGMERKIDVKEFQSMHLVSKKKNDDEDW